jgi:hypothetical protein
VIVTFLDAYNTGNVTAAARLFTDDILIADCDFQAHRPVTSTGRVEATAWLAGKARDHDMFVGLDELGFGEPNSIGQFAIAVSYRQRTSDSLRSAGFATGRTPKLAIKAGLSPDGDRLRAWVAAATCD